ncbi:MAG TPA: hypothetical protein PLZ58_04120 [Candidatus Saccharibacteria bacterium]|nr:hypothetical protein [Candidatus Saccharibacteria bacterium]
MIYLLYGAAIVLFIFVAYYSLDALLDESYVARCLSVIFWIITIAFLCYAVVESNNKGPCVKYETQMHYNAATKTMMPARVCVLRGEWVE